VLGMSKPAGMRGQVGTALDASTAAFDTGRLPGAAPASIDDTAGVFVDTLANPDREVDYSKDDLTRGEAQRIGLGLHRDYCSDLSPLYRFLSVEQHLDPLDIDCGGGIVVRLTGSMDRARAATLSGDDGIVIPDLKSGSRAIEKGAVKTSVHWPQIEVYRLMFERTAGLATVGGQVLALHTGAKPQVMASPVIDHRAAMVGDADTPGLIEHAAAMFRSGLFPPNAQSRLCSERYCARWSRCKFHG